LTLALASVLVAPSVAAQSSSIDALPAEMRTELSTAHFRTGMRYFDLGRFAEAAVEFERVFEFSHQPEIMYNIARAYEGARNFRRAVESYERVIADAPAGIDLETIRQDVARLRLLIVEQSTGSQARPGCEESPPQQRSAPQVAIVQPPLFQLRTRRVFERTALHEVGPWLVVALGMSAGAIAIWQGLNALNHGAMIDQANRGQTPWTIAVDQSFNSVGLASALAFGLTAVAGVSVTGGVVWLAARGRGQPREIVISTMTTFSTHGVLVGGVF
jgi:tetratricopeptide (TPR) repeat protein